MNGRKALAAAVVAAASGAALVAEATAHPERALSAYLPVFVTCVTTASGSLLVRAVGHVSGARFLEELRPVAERLSRLLLALSVLLLPLLFGARYLYPWAGAHLAGLDHHPLSPHKAAYLQPWAFWLRSLLAMALWVGIDVLLRRLSRRASGSLDERERLLASARLKAVAAVSLPLLCFSISIASVDWVMSLEPEFVSTGFGLRFVISSSLAALSAMAALVGLAGEARPGLAPVHSSLADGPIPWAGLGKLLLCFVMLWGYLAYSQLVVIWIGNLPREAPWYLRRIDGPWAAVAALLGVGHLALPLLALLPYGPKRRPWFLGATGVFLLAFHHLESLWLTLPPARPYGPVFGWLDLAALACLPSLLFLFDSLFAHGSTAAPLAARPAHALVGLRPEDL